MRRRRVIAVAVPVVLGLALVAGYAALRPHGPIALPPPGSDPRTVLSVYLKALKAGDCRTARELATPSFATDGELCDHVKVWSYTAPGQPGLPGNGEAIFSSELWVTGGQPAMNMGKNTWFYVLRQQADGEWRLVGGGSGP